MRLGSLCTGIGGLDLAVEQFFGAELAWCAEIDNDASRVIEARFPGLENIGNFIGRAPESVDILCAGFPCQPVSQAGRRRGVNDERWLWDDIVDLVRGMDPSPRVLVFENVTGLLRANGGGAFQRVVHGLASLGFDARWSVVRASDVGAPHQRARWFCVAANSDGSRRDPWTGLRQDGPPGIGWRRSGYRNTSADDWPDQECWCCRGSVAYDGFCGDCGCSAWGQFEWCIERWADLLGREASPPWSEYERTLSPKFVEWMMGYPPGWVTDVLVTKQRSLFGEVVCPEREPQLRVLGNAVVPQQAYAALGELVGWSE